MTWHIWLSLAVSGFALLMAIGAAAAAGAPHSVQPPQPRSCATHGHHYEARFHSEPTLQSVDRGSASKIAKLLAASMAHTYVHDICIHCGDVKRK